MKKYYFAIVLCALFAFSCANPPQEALITLAADDIEAAIIGSTAVAAAHYVNSATGTSSGTGTSAKPWKTLAQASSHTYTAGDTLNINGTFTGQVLKAAFPGTSSARIKVVGHDTGGTSGVAVMQSITVTNATYTDFSNIKAGWSSTVTTKIRPSPAIYCVLLKGTAHHLTFTDMTLHDSSEAVSVSQKTTVDNCNNITFNNLTIVRAANNGVVLNDQCGDNIHINGGSITYTGLYPLYSGATHGIYASGGHSHEFNDLTFRHNINGCEISLRRGTMIVSGCTFYGTPNSENTTDKTNKMINYNNEDPVNSNLIIQIYRNTFVGGSSASSLVAFYLGNANDGAKEVPGNWFVIYNNNFINCAFNANGSTTFGEKFNFYFRNNLFYNSSVNADKAVSGYTHTYSDNAWWGTYKKPADYNGSGTELIANPSLSNNKVTAAAYQNQGVATIVSSPKITVSYSGTAPDIGREEY